MVFWFYGSFMVDKCSSPTPKWQCLTAWNPWLWAASGMATGCYETSFLLFANSRGGRDTISTVKCPGLIMHQYPGFARRGGWMLAAGIDSHIVPSVRLSSFELTVLMHSHMQMQQLVLSLLLRPTAKLNPLSLPRCSACYPYRSFVPQWLASLQG